MNAYKFLYILNVEIKLVPELLSFLVVNNKFVQVILNDDQTKQSVVDD